MNMKINTNRNRQTSVLVLTLKEAYQLPILSLVKTKIKTKLISILKIKEKVLETLLNLIPSENK